MSTIARMLVEMAGDHSGLSRAFRESVQDAQRYGRDLRAAVNSQPIVDPNRAQSSAKLAGAMTLRGFQQGFEANMATAREQLARGIISPAQFRQAAEAAAVQFNHGLLNGIENLRSQKLLPPSVHQKLVAELKDAGMDAGRAARTQLVAELNKMGTDLQRLGGSLKSAGSTMTMGITLPVVALGTASVKSAADAAESFNKFDVLFGRMAVNVGAQLADMHRTIPATTAQLKDMTSNFQALLVPMGIAPDAAAKMSLRLTQLGGDLTSLHNIPVQETMQRLFSGLVGETEAVRRFGVDISEARLKILAHSAGLGDNVQALTRAQKTQLIFNEILRSTSVAHGDAAATAGSASNQMRFLSRDMAEAAVAIGQRLLPVVMPLIQSLTRVLESVSKLSPQTLDLAIKVALVAAAFGPLLTILGTFISMAGAAAIASGALAGTGAVAAAGGATGLAGVAVALMGPAGVIIALGLAGVALVGWLAHSRAAKLDVDKLADSFRGLSQAQLGSQLLSESQKLAQMQTAANNMAARGPRMGGTAAQQDAADMSHSANLGRQNRAIKEQQALIGGLQQAYLAKDRAARAADAETARNIARNEEMVRALSAGMNNALSAAKAEAAAARANAKDHNAYMTALAGEVSTLTDMYDMAKRFGVDTLGVTMQALAAYHEIEGQIAKAGGKLDANTAKLYNMLAALLKIRDVAAAVDLDIPRPRAGMVDRTGRLPSIPAPPTIAPTMTMNEARFNAIMQRTGEIVGAFGEKFRTMVAPLGTALGGLLNPLRFFGGVIQRLAQSLQPVLDPLLPVFEEIAAIIAETLTPVIQALAPVLASLTPLIRAIMQVVAPILQALVPLFRALVPLLTALFPVFKLLGIAATYIGQAFGIAANIVLRAMGNIIIGFGTVIKKIAEALDAIPGIDARGGIRAGQAVIDFGRGMLTAADEMKAMANDMAHAREEIRNVKMGQAADATDKFTDAITTATEVLTNVPTIFRFRQRLTEQWDPRELPPDDGRTSPFGPRRWNPAPQNPTGTTGGGANARTSAAPLDGAAVFHIEHLTIQTEGDGEATLDNLRAAVRRRALNMTGQTTRVVEGLL